jgi:hypothetical protein
MKSDGLLEAYIERFSKSRHITIEQALQQAIVREVKKYYEEEEDGK